jgi:hypothetical protein
MVSVDTAKTKLLFVAGARFSEKFCGEYAIVSVVSFYLAIKARCKELKLVFC